MDTSREADHLQVEIFRRMGPEKRLQAGIALSQTCRELLAAGAGRGDPEYGEKEVRLEVFRLILPEGLFLSVYPYVQDIPT